MKIEGGPQEEEEEAVFIRGVNTNEEGGEGGGGGGLYSCKSRGIRSTRNMGRRRRRLSSFVIQSQMRIRPTSGAKGGGEEVRSVRALCVSGFCAFRVE